MQSHATRPERLLSLAADLVILTVRNDALAVLVVERGKQPFLGAVALPGGFVEPGEDLNDAAARELEEETGLDASALRIEQLRTYGAPNRDPRGRVVSVAYLTLMPDLPLPVAGGDAQAARWVPVLPIIEGAMPVAFDHRAIIMDGVACAQRSMENSTIATEFCPPTFTITQLRKVYEIVWGQRIDPPNFHRKVTSVPGFVMRTGERVTQESGRPAELFRRGPATTLSLPILRETATRP